MADLVSLGFSADTRGLGKAQTELDRTTAAGGRLDKQSKAAERSLGLVGAAIAALGVQASTRELIAYADQWRNVNSQLRQVTTSQEELISTREKLIAVSQRTRSNLADTVDLYATLNRGTADLNISSDRLTGVVRTINNLFVAGGKPMSEATGAIRQLNQGFAAGALRGDEFNSVAEGAPRIMDALASKLNMTRGELRAFAATGGITAKTMIDALEDYSQTAQRLADMTEMTFGQSMQIAENNVVEFIGSSNELNSAFSSLGNGVVSLSQNIDSVVVAGEAFAAVYGISSVVSLGRTVAAMDLATVRATALGSAVRFALGPWGLLIAALGTAATAYQLSTKRMEESTAAAEDQEKKINKLANAYKAMTADELGNAYIKAQQRAISLDRERAKVSDELSAAMVRISNATGSVGLYTDEAADASKRLDELDKSIRDNNQSLELMSKTLNQGIIDQGKWKNAGEEAVKVSAKAKVEFDKQKKSLEEQAAQLTMSANEFEIYKAKQDAIAYKATPDMINQIVASVTALQNQREAIENTNNELDSLIANNADLFGFSNSVVDSINEQIKALEMGADAYEIYNAKMQARGAGITDDGALQEIEDRVKTLQSLREEAKETEDAMSMLSNATNDFSSSFSDASNVVVKAFGDMTDVMSKYSKDTQRLNKLQETINKERKKSGADNIALDRAQQSVTQQRMENEVDLYKTSASAAAGMFSEKTAAYKAFSAINQALSVAEIALSYQKISAGAAETTAHVAQEGTKQTSNALTAITAAFGAPWPIGFVAGAAMIGIMAALLGGSFGGGGGGGGGQLDSTQTALGGGESKSVGNSSDRLEDIQIDQLAELRGIRGALSDVQNQSFGLYRQLANVDPGWHEIRNATERMLERSFDMLNIGVTSNNANAPFTSELAGIFGSIQDTIGQSIDSLGLSTNRSLTNFVYNVGTISFDDLDGEEAQKRLNEIISSQSDRMVEALLPAMSQFQQMGEGLFETLVRVAQEQAIFNDALDSMGLSLSSVSAEMQVGIAQGIIDMVGGIDNFTDLAGSFSDEFLTDSQRMDILRGSLSDVFDQLGIGMVNTREDFAALISSLDLTTTSGQEMYAALLEINPAMADYIDMLDDLASDKLALQIDLLDAQGRSQEALALKRQDELNQMDESLRSLQLQVWAQEDLNDAREAERKILEDNVSFAEQELEKARQAEVDRINSTVDAAQEAYNAQVKIIDAQRTAYNNLISDLQSGVKTSETALKNSLNAELSRYDDLISAAKDSASAQVSAINEASQARISSLNDERNLLQGLANQYGAQSIGVSASEALAAARRGSFEPATRVETGNQTYTDAISARIGAARETFALAEIGKLADAQLSDIDRTIAASESSANRQVAAINAAADRQVAELEAQKQAVQDQVNAILGIDNSVLSLDDAIAQYQDAQSELQKAMNDGTLDRLQSQEDIALAAFNQAKTDAQTQIDALNSQVDSLLNIDNTVSTVSDAIAMLLSERQQLADFEQENMSEQLQAQHDILSATLSVRDAVSNIRIPEPPAPVVVNNSAANDDVVNELKQMRAELNNANTQIAINTAKTAGSTRNIEYSRNLA